MARLATIKTLAGFDFTFQPSLDRDRVLALAQLDFIERRKSSFFSAHPASARPTWRSPLASRRSRPATASTSNPGRTDGRAGPRRTRGTIARQSPLLLPPRQLVIIDEFGYCPCVLAATTPSPRQRPLRTARHDPDLQPGFAEGARSSAIRSSPPPCSTGSCTTPSSSRSRAPKLPPPAARRTVARAHPLKGQHRAAAAGTAAAPARPAAQTQRPNAQPAG